MGTKAVAGAQTRRFVSPPVRRRGRAIVLVSGPPAAGKTSIAVPVAKGLGFPLIAKDDIKEALFETPNGEAGDVAWSHHLSQAAMAVLWRLASRCPAAVLDANFRPHSEDERHHIIALGGTVIEIYCRCPSEEAARRFAARASSGRWHSAHALRTVTAEMLAEYDRPISMGPVIEVDTGHPVDHAALLGEVRSLL